MNITSEELRRIIKEELEAVLDEKREKKSKKKDACYRKVKSRYKVWPSAYASGALVKCRNVGAKNWGNSKNEEVELEESDGKSAKDKNYSLHDWFDDGGWVQAGGKHDGEPCAKQPGQKTKPYCRDPDDRKEMDKEERDKRAAKKRREDPNPDRKGKAKIVSQKDGRKKK